MSNRYASIVARRMRILADESDTCEFPSLAEAAEKLNVGIITASKAAKILEAEGVLARGHGRRYAIVNAENISAKKPAHSAVEQAVVRIREIIGTPQARVQIRIPVMGLVKTLGFSHRTVCDALRRLVEKGEVERCGKYYAIARERA